MERQHAIYIAAALELIREYPEMEFRVKRCLGQYGWEQIKDAERALRAQFGIKEVKEDAKRG